jgi:hypothetical protein
MKKKASRSEYQFAYRQRQLRLELLEEKLDALQAAVITLKAALRQHRIELQAAVAVLRDEVAQLRPPPKPKLGPVLPPRRILDGRL